MNKKAGEVVVGDMIGGLYGPFGYVPDENFRKVKHVARYISKDVEGRFNEEIECIVISVEEGDGMYMIPGFEEIRVK